MTPKNAEEAFLTRGYNNWKAATDAFRKLYEYRAIAMQRNCMYTLPLTIKDIGETLHPQEKHFGAF